MGYFMLGYGLKECFPVPEFSQSKVSGFYCAVWAVMGLGIVFKWTTIPYPILGIGGASFLFFISLALYRLAIGKRLALLGASTFVVYAIHEPTQTVIFRIWQAKGWPGFNSLGCYFLVPVFVFFLGVTFYYSVRRFFPGLLKYMTGGR